MTPLNFCKSDREIFYFLKKMNFRFAGEACVFHSLFQVLGFYELLFPHLLNDRFYKKTFF